MKVNELRLKLYPKDFYSQRSYYKDDLCFKISHEWDTKDSKGVMFNVGGTTLEFMWPVEEGLSDIATGSGLSLAVDDVHVLFEEIKDKVELTHELRDNSWGDTSFGVKDPSGYRISFFTQQRKYHS